MKDLIVINKENIKTKRLRKVASDRVREREKRQDVCYLI